MRAICSATLLLGLLGCDDLQKAGKSQREPATPPGVANLADADAVDAAATGSPAAKGNGDRAKPAEPQAPAGGPPQKQSIIGKMTGEVVDMKKAMAENPNLKVVDNPHKITGSDPLSAYASAYITQRSRVSLFGFQQALQLFKAEHERNPTYDEFMRMMKENRIEFAKLPHYRMYAYDAQAGKIEILEDPDETLAAMNGEFNHGNVSGCTRRRAC